MWESLQLPLLYGVSASIGNVTAPVLPLFHALFQGTVADFTPVFFFVSFVLFSHPTSRRRPVFPGLRVGVRALLLPQHRAHSPLPQQTDGPGDGLTNNFPPPHALQPSQEAPPAQRARQRLLGHPPVPGRRTLGLRGGARVPSAASSWRWAFQPCEGSAWGEGLGGGWECVCAFQTFFFYEDPSKSLMLPVIYFFFLNSFDRSQLSEELRILHCRWESRSTEQLLLGLVVFACPFLSQFVFFLSSRAKARCRAQLVPVPRAGAREGVMGDSSATPPQLPEYP